MSTTATPLAACGGATEVPEEEEPPEELLVAGRETGGGGGGGGGGSALTVAVENDQSASAATEMVGDVDTPSEVVRLAIGTTERAAPPSGAATAADAVSVSTTPDDMAAIAARRPAGPVRT
ncbi:MAG: hypothetical protein ACK5H2_09665 [Beutenbergiaceae bacterium]